MSKKIARGPESYLNEQLVLEMAPAVLESKGFKSARFFRNGGMKFVEANAFDGSKSVFWLKQGWTNTTYYSAIQFGMFEAEKNPGLLPDSVFSNYVSERVGRAEQLGATHVLMIHMVESAITNYVVLRIEDLPKAYMDQIAGWPNRARNTKTPTLYFEDSRDIAGAECVEPVTSREISLRSISGVLGDQQTPVEGIDSKKVTAEVERRLKQARFRVLVGNRCDWKCVVSGFDVREALDAAHLPGRDWRIHNSATDGIMIRADLHRLLDNGLADLEGGLFVLAKKLRKGRYSEYHQVPINS